MKIVWVSTRFSRLEAELDKLPEDENVLVVDMDRCISCGACELACQAEHRAGDMPPQGGPRIFMTRMKDGAQDPSTVRLPLSCRHCGSPCEFQDPQNFWVTCPSGREGRAQTCDGCPDRLAAGLMPACATRCSMKCIYFGTARDMWFVLSEKRLRKMGEVMAECVEER